MVLGQAHHLQQVHHSARDWGDVVVVATKKARVLGKGWVLVLDASALAHVAEALVLLHAEALEPFLGGPARAALALAQKLGALLL